METRHLSDCSPDFVKLADTTILSEGIQFQAHSQYLAAQSIFIQQLLLETGPVSWRSPLKLDTVLKARRSATVSALLVGVYNKGVASITGIHDAYRLLQLADHLNCPTILKQCQDYLNTYGATCVVLHTPEAALK